MHPGGVAVGRAVGRCRLGKGQGGKVVNGGVGFFVQLLQVGDIDAAAGNLDLFGQLVCAPVFAVIVKAYRAVLQGRVHLHCTGQVKGETVAQQGGVKVVGEQDPGLVAVGGVAGREQVGLFVSLIW